MRWTHNFGRSTLVLRFEVGERLSKSTHAVHLWKKKGFLPVCTVDEDECEACGKDFLPFWYNTDMIDHSIKLPLNDDSIRNLQAGFDIDPARTAEILRANSNRNQGLFKEIEDKRPKDSIREMAFCKACTADQQFLAWVEEICQIMDIVNSMEERILADKRIYDGLWRGLRAKPGSLTGLRFSDVPWPMNNSRSLTSPKHLTKSGIRRFLFSRCIYEKYALMSRQSPRDLLIEYRMRWDPKWFEKHLPWYSRKLPSFVTERAAILEGVALIQKYLKELEEDDWEVILGDDPSRAQWERCVKYPMRERRPIFETYKPEKWALEKVDRSINLVSLGISAGVGLAFGLLTP